MAARPIERAPRAAQRHAVAIIGLCLIVGTRGPALADDVSWLQRVQQPVRDAPREGLGALAPLLIDAKGAAITSRAGWEQKRKQIRDEWRTFLGPMPDPRPEVKLE